MPTAPPKLKTPPAPPPAPPATNGPFVAGPLQISTGGAVPTSDRVVINAVEGWGKTTMAANAPKPLILMAQGETGYETLLGHNLVPAVPRATVTSWPQMLAAIDALIDECPYQTIVMDALGGFERLCHEEVCRRDFDSNWGDRGFLSYHKGYTVAVNDWLQLLQRLDQLRAAHSPDILILSHCRIETFKNPLGPDFDRYVSDVHKQTWALTHKWVDAVLFGNFFSVVETEGKKARKGKATGGDVRVIYTQRRDSYDAKNRHGLPELIEIGDDRNKSWADLAQHLKGGAE